MTSDFDLIVFDCDGVLVDSEGISTRCVAALFRDAGFPIDEATLQERFMGISNPTMCATVEREWGRPLPEGFLDTLRHRLVEVAETELRPIDGVADAVRALPLPYCIASSSHPERIRRYLALANLTDLLNGNIFSATMVEHGKPAPDLFLLAAREMGADPHRCVVIEDSEVGVRAGKAAGMTVFGFTGGSHVTSTVHGPKLTTAGADLVFDAMADLPGLLTRSPSHAT